MAARGNDLIYPKFVKSQNPISWEQKTQTKIKTSTTQNTKHISPSTETPEPRTQIGTTHNSALSGQNARKSPTTTHLTVACWHQLGGLQNRVGVATRRRRKQPRGNDECAGNEPKVLAIAELAQQLEWAKFICAASIAEMFQKEIETAVSLSSSATRNWIRLHKWTDSEIYYIHQHPGRWNVRGTCDTLRCYGNTAVNWGSDFTTSTCSQSIERGNRLPSRANGV